MSSEEEADPTLEPAESADIPLEEARRERFLLTPFRLPAQNSLYLANEDVARFLNGLVALWHPALLHGASGLPRLASPYDHEQPVRGHVYALPDNPPPVLPDDWDQRVRDAGAVVVRATPERSETEAHLREALPTEDPTLRALLELPPERVRPFQAIGFGHAHLEALFEAMDHQNVLNTDELWQDVQAAVAAVLDPDPNVFHQHLQSAADKLRSAREVVYPVTVHLIDLTLLSEKNLDRPFPAAFEHDQPFNLLACSSLLERLAHEQPERLAVLRERVTAGTAEVVGGCQVEREDPLLPVESQVWNVVKGTTTAAELLGQELRVFGRKRFGFQPQTPSLLQAAGLTRGLFLTFDESVAPSQNGVVINWPAPDGKQVDAFCRAPHPADDPQTFFHVAHHLHQTIMQDHVATLAILHKDAPACPWYEDWLELSRFGPILGQWTTLSAYLDEVSAGDYTSPMPADDFHGDYLSERVGPEAEAGADPDTSGEDGEASGGVEPRRERPGGSPDPVSAFAQHARARRRLDTAWTLSALHRALAGKNDNLALESRLSALEDRIESKAPATLKGSDEAKELAELMQQAAEALAQRLLSRAEQQTPGYMLLNPCSFARRVVLELEGMELPLPTEGPVKACQVEGGVGRLVAEIPALGFAWLPRSAPGFRPAPPKMKMADERCVRNEFFEAEIDPATGGLKAIRDQRTRINRLGQQLVFNPGSDLRVKQVKTTSTGPAYGEIVTEGALVDEQDEVMATFRQRFRAWLGRPVLDMRLEIYPNRPPAGYPWHAYYGCRFAWRDERAVLLRGVGGAGVMTSQTRPETPDFLDIRLGQQATVILTGGLPFHQRHGGRMLDVILVPPGETAQVFDLAIGLDRDYPSLTALGMVTPTVVVPVSKGPPHIGATGWLFHLDAPHVMLTSLRPAPDGADGVVARLLECGGHTGQATLRRVRDPVKAERTDARGLSQADANIESDSVSFEVSEGELIHLRVDFSVEQSPDEAPPDEPAEESTEEPM